MLYSIYNYEDSENHWEIDIPAVVASGFENEITVEVKSSFTRFSSIQVALTSNNGYKLVNHKGESISYQLLTEEGGSVAFQDGILYSAVPSYDTVSGEIGVHTMKFYVDLTGVAASIGTYRDMISFNVTYDSGQLTDEDLNY